MAKRGAAEHPKTRRLARALNCPNWAALGLLENVWHWLYRYAPDGAISDTGLEDCAFHIRFDEGGEPLRDALRASGWLDQLPDGRWMMHDWAEHADDSVHMALARKKARFADGAAPRLGRLPKVEQERLQQFYAATENDHRTNSAQHANGVRTDSALPCPTLPSHASPSTPDAERESDPKVTDQVGERDLGQDFTDTLRAQSAPKANPDSLRRTELFGFDPVPLVEGRAYFNRSLGNLDWSDLKAELLGFAERGSPITETQFRKALKVGFDACHEKHGNRPKSLVWLISALADLDTSDGEPAPVAAVCSATGVRAPELPSQHERVRLEKLWGRSIADNDREGQERAAAGIRSLYEAREWTGPALEKSIRASRDGARDWAQRFQRMDRASHEPSLTAAS
ncbi:MAG: hypothetical protein ACO1SX_28280 [Actinomycetota bacterium]